MASGLDELGVKCTKIKTQTVVLIGVVYFHMYRLYRCFMILCRSLWFCCSLLSSIHLLYFE